MRPGAKSRRDKFSVGQRVRWRRGSTMAGECGTIVAGRGPREWDEYEKIDGRLRLTGAQGTGPAYSVKADCHGGLWAAKSSEIEPINYDGNQRVAWADCAWSPMKSAVILAAATKPEIVDKIKNVLQKFADGRDDPVSIFGAAALAYIEHLEKQQKRRTKQ